MRRGFVAPIFIIAGDNDIAHAGQEVKSGTFDYVVKPFNARTLVTRVGGAVVAFAKRGAHTVDAGRAGVEFPGRRR